MKLGIIAYLPPSRIGNTYEFVSNLKDYPPENKVYFYSDQFWTGLGVDVTLIETPSIHLDPYRKDAPANLGIVNMVFLRGVQLAIRNGLDRFLFIESDCRFTAKGWDAAMIDELGNDDCLIAGTIACQNPDLGTKEFRLAWDEFVGKTNLNDHNWPATKYVRQGAPCSPFVNGALAIYDTAAVKDLLGKCKIADVCRKMPAYDLYLGRLMTRKYGDIGAFRRMKHLKSSCSLYVSGGSPMSEFLKMRSTNGSYVAIHPIKDRWKPKAGILRAPNQINIRRYHSYGDVIMASVVATKLKEHGYRAGFITNKVIAEMFTGHPHIDKLVGIGSISDNSVDSHVCLDNVTEISEDRNRKSSQRIFLENAYASLAKYGISLSDYANAVPVLSVTDEERNRALCELRNIPRPWVMVVPRSNSFPNRTLSRKTCEGLVGLVNGSLIWTGTDPSVKGYHDLKHRDIRRLMAQIGVADLVVSVDTGPMHIAAAFNRPIVAIRQCINPDLRISNKRDYVSVGNGMDCLGCYNSHCPINKNEPPCQQVDPMVIADAANAKLDAYLGHSVSAIIPVYKPDGARLNRCLNHILPEVDEVVIGVDGGGSLPEIVKHPKVKVVFGPSERRGYGKTCNMAARNSTGHWLLMLNDDVFVDPRAVSKMIAPADEKTGIIGALLRYPDGKIQHGGTRRDPGGASGYGHIDHRRPTATVRSRVEMENVTFAMAAVRRSAFYDVAAFDERYDCYCEDADMCISVRYRGWKVIYEPSATAIHAESQTTTMVDKNEMTRLSHVEFKKKWDWYFIKNRNVKGLGVFA